MGFFVGATVGSFLNVVIYRLPRGLSIAKPKHSFCTECKKQLTMAELVPLFSWLFQKGRCSCGKTKVSSRYFWVEVINGALWAGIWYQQLVVSPDLYAYREADPVRAIGYMLFASAIVVAIFTDLAFYIIPDEVNAFMLIVGFGMNIAYAAMGNKVAWMWGMPSSVAGALVGLGILWGITFLGRVAFGKDAMGHGDIKMARGIGAVLLPVLAGISFALAVVLGAVLGVVMIFVRNQMEKKAKAAGVVEPEPAGDDEVYVPESIPSLLKSLVGYLLLMDIIGLFFPKVYLFWFGEDPTSSEVIDEDFKVEPTMIPFGPYLAGGALLAMFLSGPLVRMVMQYWADMTKP